MSETVFEIIEPILHESASNGEQMDVDGEKASREIDEV